MRVVVVLAVSIAVVASSPACSHVQLRSAPPATAPPRTRLAAYHALRPAGQMTEVNVAVTRSYVSVTTNEHLILANGGSIEHADDLLPVLDPDTPAAGAARRSAAARQSGLKWTLGTTLVAAAGLGMVVHGLPSYDCVLPEDDCYDPNGDTFVYRGWSSRRSPRPPA